VENFMVMRSLPLAAMLGIAAGCYSTPTVDPYPGPWRIDNFDDSNGDPEAPLFDHWECRPRDSSHPISKCEVIADPVPDPDKPGNKVLHLGSTLWPLEAGRDYFTRSEVASFIERPLDLTPYGAIRFRVKLDVSPSLAPLLKVQLSCTHQQSGGEGPSPTPCVIATVISDKQIDPSRYNSWLVLEPNLSKFSDPENTVGGVAACLTGIDGIKITVDSDKKVENGRSEEFDLYVDDIELVPLD
jgi:hypothetical protein